jgi:hypothetical protein
MNDFSQIMVGLGRGIIKIMISALVGFGVGLLVIGVGTEGHHGDMPRSNSPYYLGTGAGLLAGGGAMFVLFMIPWLFKRAPAVVYSEEPVPTRAVPPSAPPPRGERSGSEFYEKSP